MKYILRGSIVTFNSRRRVIRDGFVGIANSKISFVKDDENKIPKKFQNENVIKTDGFIYPGLIDLHNHLAYNFIPLWKIDRKFETRYQWPKLSRYKSEITGPKNLLVRANAVELLKYVESKGLVSGVTCIDGWATLSRPYAAWLLRNVEVQPFGGIEPKVYQSVMRIQPGQFSKKKEHMKKGNAFIYHLAEGTADKLHEEYDDIKQNGLITGKLVGVHCTALRSKHWKLMGKKKSKLVWSPLSNLLLYGKTTDVVSAKKKGVLICLGSDWSPTGTKSPLWELKVADLVNKEDFKGYFSDKRLTEMVTINPAKAVGFDDKIGIIKARHYADLVIFEKVNPDPYRNLIECTEKNLILSIIAGVPRYGDHKLLSKLIKIPEKIKVKKIVKGMDILEPGKEYGNIKFSKVRSSLRNTLKNPHKATDRVFKSVQKFLKSREVPMELIPDEDAELFLNKPPSHPNEDMSVNETFDEFLKRTNKRGKFDVTKIKTLNQFTEKVLETREIKMPKLDPLTMYDDKKFFKTLMKNPNIPKYLSNLENYLT